MSAKRLLSLVILLGVLVLAAVMVKRQPAPIRLAEETGFERLVPASLQAESIQGIDLYLGAKAEEVVRLRRQDGAWQAASSYNAPVQTEKISKFLTALSALEGEVRAEQAELLGDFRLQDAEALHLRLFTDSSTTPALHLLAGKGSGRNGFVRLANSPRVYNVNLNIPQEAGVLASAPDQPPQAKPWLNLQIQDVPKEQITALDLYTAERTLQFAVAPPTTAPAAGTGTETAAAASWRLASPDLPYAVKQSGVEGLIASLRTLRAEDVADPGKAAAYGLDHPAYRVTMSVQGANQEARQITLALGQAVSEQDSKRYARLDAQGLVYILPAWVFNRLFPPAKELLELPGLAAQTEAVQQIAWQYGEVSWTLERAASISPATGDTPPVVWQLAEAPQVPVDGPAVEAVLKALGQLTVEDWLAQPATPTGLEQPQLALQVTLADSRATQVTLGAIRDGSGGGQYARVSDAVGTQVVSADTAKALIDALLALPPSDQSAVPPSKPAN